MTNEQIEKRFLFDLEIGIFKNCFGIIMFSDYNPNTQIIKKILLKFGYVDTTNYEILEKNKMLYTILNIEYETKEFNWSAGYLSMIYPYVNTCPEYLEKYKL